MTRTRLILAALLVALAAAPAAAQAVVVKRVAGPKAAVWQGSRFRVSDIVANPSAIRSSRATVTYWLVHGRKRVRIGHRTVTSLRAHRSSHGVRTLTMPRRVAPTHYRLLACTSAWSCTTARAHLTVLDPRPTPLDRPVVTGRTVDGQTLTAQIGSWRARGRIAYALEWRRCASGACTPIAGATAATYTLTPDDVGQRIRVVVTGRAAAGIASSESAVTAPIAPLPPANTATPTISGTALAGLTVSATNGDWVGTPPLTFSYQWQHCDADGVGCADIPGATDTTYAVSDADAGAIRLAVTATGRGGSTTALSPPIRSGSWRNPVYDAAPVPDPFVLDNDNAHDDYWSFNTGGGFPILHSSDLIHWQRQGSAFKARPGWAVTSGDYHPWAPSVLQTAPGSYVMYYVSISAQYGVNCVGVATATKPGGPYTDHGPLTDPTADPAAEPIGCGDGQGQGNIDPSPFVDPSGNTFLYVSTNSPARTVSVIPLSGDRLNAAGARVALFAGDPGTWEAAASDAPTVENPFGLLHNGTYYVFYSGGNWQTHYGMGYATSASPTGPFTKSPHNPILAETPAVASPGGGDQPVVGPHGGTWLAYHGRDTTEANPRTLRLDPFGWSDSGPVIGGPSSDPQPLAP